MKGLVGKIPVCGICGGYQMLGEEITDSEGMESGGAVKGMGLLPVTTKLQKEKVRRQVQGTINRISGTFSVLSGLAYAGYEIHMGRSRLYSDDGGAHVTEEVLVGGEIPEVYGTYVHGIFDKGETVSALVGELARKKGLVLGNRACMDYREYKEKQYDKLADILTEHLDREHIYGLLREAHIR